MPDQNSRTVTEVDSDETRGQSQASTVNASDTRDQTVTQTSAAKVVTSVNGARTTTSTSGAKTGGQTASEPAKFTVTFKLTLLNREPIDPNDLTGC